VKYLLDTEVWLWSLSEPDRINAKTRNLLARGDEELFLSAASSWEIAIKFALGKLPLPEAPASYVPKRMEAQGIRALPIEHSHALRVSAMPQYHKDPFDRLLIAQAEAEKMTILTADAAFRKYGAKLHWSGR
jgi:PIN domain nuclease of toxin-antitoxin system